MNKSMLERKRSLKEGEIVKLCFDEAFKIMYANAEHIEILTVLLSKILKVEYKDLEGKIELLQVRVANKTLGEKKCERDVVVSIKEDSEYNLVLEVNVKNKFYQSIMDRNLYYAFQMAGRGLMERETYDNIRYTFLINFNTFFVNQKEKNVFEEFVLKDRYGLVLSEKYKVLNINIEECYNLWYHNKYQGKFESYEEDLMLLCASMMVEKEEEFKRIIEMIRMKPEIKKLMEGVVKEMNTDERLVTEYRTWKDENERINASIMNEVKKEGIKEGLKQTAINMYKNQLSLEMISKYTKLSINEIKEIIANN